MQQASENGILFELNKEISNKLSALGLLFRIFSRCKSSYSIEDKIKRVPNKYSENGKKIQDLFGIRVVLYFQDDLDVAIEALESIFETIDISKSEVDTEKFSPTVCNYVFRLREEHSIRSKILQENKLVDTTFEVQFRTILSEGWHEVEHDLRFKCKDDWVDHDDLNRSLNGIYAALSISDWGMLQLFESLAYKHYKSGNLEALLRIKFRLRLQDKLCKDLKGMISKDIAKKIYRIERAEFLSKLNSLNITLPMSFNNLVYLLNFLYLKEEIISDSVPAVIAKKYLSENKN